MKFKKILNVVSIIPMFLVPFMSVSCSNNANQHKTTYNGDISYFVASVGNGEFTFLKEGNKAIMMDCGIGIQNDVDFKYSENSSALQAKKWTAINDYDFVKKLLNEQGIDEIEAIFISHDHEDHYNELLNILNPDKIGIKVDNIVLPIVFDDAEQAIRKIDSNVKIYDDFAEYYDFGGISFQNLTSEIDHNLLKKQTDPNNYSMILRFTVDGKTFMFTGDATNWTLNQLKILDDSDSLLKQKVDLLVAPHHGSANSAYKILEYLPNNVENTIISGTAATDEWQQYSGGHNFPESVELQEVEKYSNNVYLTGDINESNSDELNNKINANNKTYEYKITKNNNSYDYELITHDETVVNINNY